MLSQTKGTKSSLLTAFKQTGKICDNYQFFPEQLVLPLVFGIQEGKKHEKLGGNYMIPACRDEISTCPSQDRFHPTITCGN